MKIRKSLVLLPALAATAILAGQPAAAQPNTKAEQQLEKTLAGRSAGTPVDCIRQMDIRSSRIFDRTAILYEMNNGTYYLNRPPNGASSLSSGDVMVTDTHSPNLCSVDIVRFQDQSTHMQTGSVGLGKFVPYTKH
jgi:hypothetical protein